MRSGPVLSSGKPACCKQYPDPPGRLWRGSRNRPPCPRKRKHRIPARPETHASPARIPDRWSQPQRPQSGQKDPSRPSRRRRRIRGHLQPRALPALGNRVDTGCIEPHHRHRSGLRERIKAIFHRKNKTFPHSLERRQPVCFNFILFRGRVKRRRPGPPMTNPQDAQGLSLFSQGKPLFVFFLPDGGRHENPGTFCHDDAPPRPGPRHPHHFGVRLSFLSVLKG